MTERLYPIYADLSGRSVLVVGGGSVAARKVRRLLECGADVTVVSRETCDALNDLNTDNNLHIIHRSYRDGDAEGRWLVVAATDSEGVNRRVSRQAEERNIFCNVVDVPQLCSFHVPAVVRRGLLQLAISTGGASPAMARRLRIELEEQFGPAYAHLLDGMQRLRDHVQSTYPDQPDKRREVFESFLDSPAPGLLLNENDEEAFEEELEQWISC
jgi:precorrin-2 dehydrogenase/sirohydrochlorin ferrochelatase